jgi:hypothetical protein
MTTTLPDIGRNGLVNSVRRLSGLNNPGYRKVDSSADFIAGMVANLEADANGDPVLTVANATDTAIVGIFYCHKTTSFYRPITAESKTFGTSPNTATVIYLDHANVKSGSVRVTTSLGVPWTETTHYVVSTTNGYITRTSTGIGASDTVLVSYLYQDPDLSGIDQTLGSGMAATLEDNGEIATLVYDTAKAYTLMGSLYSDANGYLTSTNGGGSVVGKCTQVPTASDPELRYKLTV